MKRTIAAVLTVVAVIGGTATAANAGHVWLKTDTAKTSGSTWALGSAWK